ncbi:glycosyltransferase family 87 protein [Streptomyces graminofaciens]|uniref:glycosyltransferase family 87 protein n=1 Tax=Streptomyces graminofaciens TaxID=68212 RepID=UPI0025741222|nr:glycosyltransferase family 87 protein [Streptomyces graminofaciens]
MDRAGTRRLPWILLASWGASRLVLLLYVFKVLVFPGPDVTGDVSFIYHGWYEVLRTGTYPQGDVTWQYPPAAALAILSPALLPFLDYASAFFVLALLADLAVLTLLLHAGSRPGRTRRGAWVWVVGLPLLGPTVYARYDVMVTAVAVAALLAGSRHPRVMGALVAFGALLKVWPVLLLLGARTRAAWASAAVTAGSLALLFALAMPGAFDFLSFQRDRGTEVESLGALVFHVARQFGWNGQVLLNYGSVEFLGDYVDVVSNAALLLSAAAFAWLLLWRARARRFAPHTLADAAFVAVLMFTTTSRVISPQYMVWLVGLAAVCLCFRASRMTTPAVVVLVASFVTVLEFPIWFGHVVMSDWLGVTLMFLRNGLLVLATLLAALELWQEHAPRKGRGELRDQPHATRSQEPHPGVWERGPQRMGTGRGGGGETLDQPS